MIEMWNQAQVKLIGRKPFRQELHLSVALFPNAGCQDLHDGKRVYLLGNEKYAYP